MIQMHREDINNEPDLQQIDLRVIDEIQLEDDGRLYLFANNGELILIFFCQIHYVRGY